LDKLLNEVDLQEYFSMKINNQTLRQIIKEELDNVLMEQDFDYDTGFPITSSGAKKALNNPKTMERINQMGSTFVKIIKWASNASDKNYSEDEISKTLKDFSKKSVEATRTKAATRRAEEKIEKDKEKYEKLLAQNNDEWIDKEISMFDKYIDAALKTKKEFLQNVEKNGDEFYRNKFPNWDEIKNAMISMADEQVKSLRAQKKISGEYYSKS